MDNIVVSINQNIYIIMMFLKGKQTTRSKARWKPLLKDFFFTLKSRGQIERKTAGQNYNQLRSEDHANI